MYAGRHEEALTAIKHAFQLNPKPPEDYYGLLGRAEFFNSNYQNALSSQLKAGEQNLRFRHELLMTYGELGRTDDAAAVLEKIQYRMPFANLGYYRTRYAHYERELDVEHMIGALRKAGVPPNAYGFEGSSADRLGADELQTLVTGNAWVGTDGLGMHFVQQISADGRIAFRNSTSLLVGKSWIDSDRLCVRFRTSMQGRDDCGYVYRNPNGSAAEQNEYVRVALGSIYYFSLK